MQLNEDIIEAFFYNICFILEWSKDIKFTTIYNHYISLLMMKNCKLFVTHKNYIWTMSSIQQIFCSNIENTLDIEF